MIRKLLIIGGLLLMAGATKAQTSTGIGTISPDANAILDVSSNAKGMLIPRMTISDRTTNIPTPTEGLLVYQTDSVKGLYSYTNGAWRRMNANSDVIRHYKLGTSPFSFTSTVNNTGYFLLPGLADTITVSAPTTLNLFANVGVWNNAATANNFGTADIAVVVDNAILTDGGYSRVTVINPATTGQAGVTATFATQVILPAGTHIIALAAQRVANTAGAQINVSSTNATSVFPSEMILQYSTN